MKKFILKRIMQYTEESEVQAESFEAAIELLEGGIELERVWDDTMMDQNVEFVGDEDLS